MSYRDVHEVHIKDSHGERRLLVKKHGFVSILSVFLADRVRTVIIDHRGGIAVRSLHLKLRTASGPIGSEQELHRRCEIDADGIVAAASELLSPESETPESMRRNRTEEL